MYHLGRRSEHHLGVRSLLDMSFHLENEHLHRKPNSSWIKWQFLFTRYFALAAQITNRSIEQAIERDNLISRGALKNWYMCQVIIGSILMTAVEIILMARVYALYKKSVWVGIIFACLILGEISAVVAGTILSCPEKNFTAVDILISSPKSYTYFGISAIISQFTILALTLFKYKIAVQHGWGKAPIMMLMVRDGTAAFFIFLLITTMTIVATGMQTKYAPLGNSWFLSIVACAGCRLIINMQKLPTRSEATADRLTGTVQLTTVWNEVEFEMTNYEHRRHGHLP
ncbi:hypothetical protein BDN70DRAFT_450973 [Pholiota conissans]|uniref:Uncharacterized protein n=1 Tax=Pholiota conissans TaxID=109636 RepID=A0A9P6D425_9AGAR|nr:hypothetical protein BDN70DRAFT_450973 [Pholiota conissans]